MKRQIICLLAAAAVLAGCAGKSDADKAQAILDEAQAYANAGNFNQARIVMDSIHATYPMEVAIRRKAKALEDSITYVEAGRNLQYSDSLLQTLLPQVDPLLKKFRYEKNEKYESEGRYVHRLLVTDNNTSRCYLQAYITDARNVLVKCYYYGAGQLLQNAVELSANEQVVRYEGEGHGFDTGGYHSILTFENDKALEILNFISSNMDARIRVNEIGTNAAGKETNQVFYLSDSEKTALTDSYQLGLLFSDIKQCENQMRVSDLQIQKYQNKQISQKTEQK